MNYINNEKAESFFFQHMKGITLAKARDNNKGITALNDITARGKNETRNNTRK
jgi:hypothetical protein